MLYLLFTELCTILKVFNLNLGIWRIIDFLRYPWSRFINFRYFVLSPPTRGPCLLTPVTVRSTWTWYCSPTNVTDHMVTRVVSVAHVKGRGTPFTLEYKQKTNSKPIINQNTFKHQDVFQFRLPVCLRLPGLEWRSQRSGNPSSHSPLLNSLLLPNRTVPTSTNASSTTTSPVDPSLSCSSSYTSTDAWLQPVCSCTRTLYSGSTADQTYNISGFNQRMQNFNRYPIGFWLPLQSNTDTMQLHSHLGDRIQDSFREILSLSADKEGFS